MNKLLEQFILESRDFLLAIGDSLISLEKEPENEALMNELFRYVHTLKGNSGLFDFPDMTKVLHASEDLMDSIRSGDTKYSEYVADLLLEVTDFISNLMNEIESTEQISSHNALPAADLAKKIRLYLEKGEISLVDTSIGDDVVNSLAKERLILSVDFLKSLPEEQWKTIWSHNCEAQNLHLIKYSPDEGCFFSGEDPLYHVLHLPQRLSFSIKTRDAVVINNEFDCYRCILDFYILTDLAFDDIVDYFRYMPDQISIKCVDSDSVIFFREFNEETDISYDISLALFELFKHGNINGLREKTAELLAQLDQNTRIFQILSWLLVILESDTNHSSLCEKILNCLTQDDDHLLTKFDVFNVRHRNVDDLFNCRVFGDELIKSVATAQKEMLLLSESSAWIDGNVMSVAATLSACFNGNKDYVSVIDVLLAKSLKEKNTALFLSWLAPLTNKNELNAEHIDATASEHISASQKRHDDDFAINKILKVDQTKIDRLMDLIGEMVVAKNSLPYLANRAENVFGIRELSREIKSQFAVINRISEEMQDAIMQIRMMPVSTIFQRFPRLIRDISKKLNKDVALSLEGEDTEADKNIIEKLADPLIHIIRNSLDHGIELPEVRVAAGKPAKGKLTIKASQEGDHVIIEITDDGKGIDPAIIKQKAFEKGVISENECAGMSDKEAIYLIFAAGFSTADAISDLSGRGVGMDVVKNTIQKIGGSVLLDSQVGVGTKLKLILPLSLAVSNVMIITSDDQYFGFPIDALIETVRLPRSDIRTIKNQKTTILRDRVIPLFALNDLLQIASPPLLNADDEYAVLILKNGSEQVGLLVDDFQEVVDVILKPLPGDLGSLACYSGTALLGDGSVLMVLNPKGLL